MTVLTKVSSVKTASSPNSFSDDGSSSADELLDLESASSSEDESEEESDFHKAGLRPAQRSYDVGGYAKLNGRGPITC